MAKNRNKSKKKASTSMNIDEAAIVAPQAMDTSEVVASSRSQISRKPKGVQMKRTKNVRRLKAIAKAVSQNEKSAAKVVKNESKTLRTQSAKKLYD
ncbi:uncharacterized protein LOC112514965 isoform X2 [Cynara cardunculus var. scolymus]|uniref:uncharacterized protein LOC112514965 isoform X2 n=1 Tax=Cynara cardunculus var. scolymus TaxID=59895 RepID=UPI000D627CBE|nr:uncharacterized protein LOC112514965 isoform X2 [Cynara cardunculus var. scolymus]